MVRLGQVFLALTLHKNAMIIRVENKSLENSLKSYYIYTKSGKASSQFHFTLCGLAAAQMNLLEGDLISSRPHKK